MSWKAHDFEDGSYGLEHRKQGGWVLVKQNQEPLKFRDKPERDRVLREILIGERQDRYGSHHRKRK